MSVPDTTTCPICYCMIDMAFMVRHVEYHQEAGDVTTPDEWAYDENTDDPFGHDNVIQVDF
jgi:hypothetical protein